MTKIRVLAKTYKIPFGVCVFFTKFVIAEQIPDLVKRFGANLHLITWTREEAPPSGASSLERLASECRSGDAKAQKALFDALSPKMMAVCLRYMGNMEDAEDVLQDGFITLFTKIDSYQGPQPFRPGSHAGAKNGIQGTCPPYFGPPGRRKNRLQHVRGGRLFSQGNREGVGLHGGNLPL